MRKPLSLSKVLIVGLVRNCAEVIEREVQIINSAFSEAATVNFLVIESDSDDGTLTELEMLSENENFNFVSLGNLRKQSPKRTERIALCRNRYIEELRANKQFSDVDYVVVADLDGVNSQLNETAVKSCWQLTEDWDVCFANQSKAYYDIWALRHKMWSPNDCWQAYKFLLSHGKSKFSALHAAVYSRMITIKCDADAIEVDSAFGGLGIYKKSALLSSKYIGLDENGEEFCEHVSLHKTMREKGLRLYIVPSLINCGWNKHSNNLRMAARIKAQLCQGINELVRFFISKQKRKNILNKS